MVNHRAILWIVGSLILIAAIGLRFASLDARPFHGDEAVNAVKFEQLRQTGVYEYDPHEYHGPILPYASWLTVPLFSDSLADSTEADYRIGAAIAGVLLVAVTLCMAGMIGTLEALIAALGITLSLLFTAISRYYIHEIYLVLFTATAIVCGYRYGVTGRARWAVLCGVSLGLMHATKETCIIAYFAMAVAIGLDLILERRKQRFSSIPWLKLWPLAAGVGAMIATSVILFSSFATHWPGVIDSVTTYGVYLNRGTGIGDGSGGEALHIHPWHWYLQRLAWHQPIKSGPWYTEAIFLALSLFTLCQTIFFALRPARGHRKNPITRPIRFFVIFTVIMLLFYSTLSYKTPWTMLGFAYGLIVLSGVGAVQLLRLAPGCGAKAVVAMIFAAAFGHLAWQDYRANFKLHTHRTNPYVYAHPTANVRDIEDRIRAINDSGSPIRFALVVQEENIWPVPFYLRHVEKVGYPATIEQLKDFPPADIVLVSDQRSNDFIKAYGQAYSDPLFFGVRPQDDVMLVMFVRKDLWERYLKSID